MLPRISVVSIAFLAFLFSQAAPAFAAEAPDWAVMISGDQTNHKIMDGSGINLGIKDSEMRVLTAWHVVKDSVTATVTFPNGDTYKAYKSDIQQIENRDIALISIHGPFRNESVASLTQVPAYLTAFTGFGQTRSDQLIQVAGQVFYRQDDGTFIAACEKCTFGDSGGGMFTTDGHVFGLMVAVTHFVDKTQQPVLIFEPIPTEFLPAGLVASR